MSPLAPGSYDRESGGVLVMVALWLPLLLILASFVIDVSNWFEHQRHLQTQADAGALAAGGSFAFPSCDNSAITNMATQYANAENPQVGGTQPAVTALINSTSYFNQGGSNFSDGQPCSDEYVDVKMTESNLPLFFGILGLFGGPTTVPAINAHARVSILTETGQGGALPIGVPDVNPSDAAAIVVDDTTGATVTTARLTANGTTSAGGTTLSEWDNTGSPATLTVPATGENLAVVVALSGNPIDLTSNNVNTICAEPLVECFAENANATGWTGLTFIHGYPTAGTGTAPAPIIRNATLSGCGTPDAYFTDDGTCAPLLTVQADVGGTPPAGATATATGAGCPKAGCKLTYNAAGSVWSGTIGAPGAGTSGPYPITFSYCATKNSCSPAVEVQRMFVGSSDPTVSGPIELVQVGSQSGAILTNSLAAGTYSAATGNGIVFHVGVLENLANAQSTSDQPTLMRLASNGSNSSRNQSLDCDPNYPNLRDELHYGCGPQYQVNQGLAPWNPCPSPSVFGMTQPWQCVNIQTGGASGQVWQGLDARFGDQNGSCPNPSHWALFPNLPAGDPRIVQVFLVPFGSFSGSGSGSVPVEGFATFYVTGWGNDPCKTGPAWPAAPVDGRDDAAPKDYIIGHFIKYVNQLNNGTGGGVCNPNSLNTCIAVLTQ